MRPQLGRPRTLTLAAAACVMLLAVLAGACASGAPTDEPGASPEEAFATYRALLDARALSASAQVLTPGSRELLERGSSRGQQASEAAALATAEHAAEFVVSGDRAVVRFPGVDELSPYFLSRGTSGWQIDLRSMAEYIAFDAMNHWRFRSTSHPYMFAFR